MNPRMHSPSLVATGTLALALAACKTPAPSPAQPPAKVDDAQARARAEAEARRKMEEDARQKREAQLVAERARLAEAERQRQAFQMAAQAALQDIHFDFDQSDIKGEWRATLLKVADFMRSYPKSQVQIEGHCDERGTVEYNIALGDRRAHAAADYLASLGVARNRLSAVSYGKERPLCTEASESCWARNRRAHFLLKD